MRTDTLPKTGGASKSSGCGCRCGKTPGATGCTCTDRPSCPDSGVLRPNFFAGQLLTEDDLQQITVYQNGKRQLTNRYVFGTGVVCGFTVAPAGPAMPGSVIVQPGYALDCCGNDIVLSCPFTIDVNAMIRAAGLDCGDPCADAGDKPRKYFLYVKYTEVPSEPVSPYSPDGTTTCVNTRVQESCSFELRCPPQKPKLAADLAARLRQIFDDATLANDIDLNRWHDLWTHRARLLSEKPVKLMGPDSKALDGVSSAIGTAVGVMATPVWNEAALEQAVTALLGPARTVARFLFVGPQEWTDVDALRKYQSGGAAPTLVSVLVQTAVTQLADAAATLQKLIWPRFSPAAQTRANLLVQEIMRWTGTDAQVEVLRHRIDVRLFIVNNEDGEPYNLEPYSFYRYYQVRTDLSKQHAWAQPPVGDDFTKDILNHFHDHVRAAREAIDLNLRGALCAALNPPCAPCDDPGVLLASVEVHCCMVGCVCNLVRTIILSPAALGYWLPIQELVSALCCGKEPLERKDEKLDVMLALYTKAGREFIATKPAPKKPAPTQGGES
jgi:hypothetical protein